MKATEFPKVVEAKGFITDISLHDSPSERGRWVIVRRTYDTINEALDLKTAAPWVRLRAAMRGMQL